MSAARSPAAPYGSYAERAVCTLDLVYRLPDQVSFAEGAGVGVPYMTAWRALFDKARAMPGETVLIHGASGAVGVAADADSERSRAARLRHRG